MLDLSGIVATGDVQGWRALLREIDRDEVAEMAVIAGGDPALALAAWEKFGCGFQLVALDAKGELSDAGADWIGPYADHLIRAGIPADRITPVLRPRQAVAVDLVAALGSFGVDRRINNLGWYLRRALHETSRLLIDVRKGSGGYPFLKRFGNARAVTTWSHDGAEVHRIALTVEPAKANSSDMQWGRIAAGLIGDDGWYRNNDRHSLTYIPRGRTLCVTFDNLDIAMNNRDDRRPWGFKFIEDQGWSMLGVMANGWTWYRDPWVTAEFDRLRDDGFFARFDRVIFYGASMGGYGALVFSAAAPGANVVAFSPQSVLDKDLVPWETRYRVAWDNDFTDHYGDAAKTTSAAARVSLIYDPYSPLDAGHVARLSGHNLQHLRCPFLGHRVGSSLQQMGILQPIVLKAMEGALSDAEFYRALRARTSFRRYRKEIVDMLIDRGRPGLARRLCLRFLKDGPDDFFEKALRRLPA